MLLLLLLRGLLFIMIVLRGERFLAMLRVPLQDLLVDLVVVVTVLLKRFLVVFLLFQALLLGLLGVVFRVLVNDSGTCYAGGTSGGSIAALVALLLRLRVRD
jgi:hypothetical protein